MATAGRTRVLFFNPTPSFYLLSSPRWSLLKYGYLYYLHVVHAIGLYVFLIGRYGRTDHPFVLSRAPVPAPYSTRPTTYPWFVLLADSLTVFGTARHCTGMILISDSGSYTE